ncbi:MAG TPA: hypothetical protein VJU81_05720 [Methylomirabilota bacterium]|nr:hypothetical protein [Methylomirabilota bacterium]
MTVHDAAVGVRVAVEGRSGVVAMGLHHVLGRHVSGAADGARDPEHAQHHQHHRHRQLERQAHPRRHRPA